MSEDIDDFLIIKYIEESEEHPTMKELLDEYQIPEWDLIDRSIFFRSLILLVSCNKIIYDHEHDSWFLPTPMSDDFIALSTKQR